MSATATPSFTPSAEELELLREIVEAHAALDRLAGSPGEQRSAQLLAEQLEREGAPARVEDAQFERAWAATFAALTALSGLAAVAGRRAGLLRRLPLAAVSAAAGLLIADDIDNGARPLRRGLLPRGRTTNVIAELGDRGAPRTLVVLAHHDAARTGKLFDQTWQQWLYRRFPDLVTGAKNSPPQWLPAVVGPLLAAAGTLTGNRRLRRIGIVMNVLGVGILGDIARGKVVPGANDNLSGVAVLVALARRLRQRPVDGLRVLLVSAGAEEELQGGIYGFLEEHGHELDRASTFFLVPDTVGSPQLVMLEGEGPVRMHDYDQAARDLTAQVAAEQGVSLERGLRSRFSTDAIVPSKAGYPTAALVSLAPWRAPSNYHLPSDTPANLDYATVAATTELAEALARKLAAQG